MKTRFLIFLAAMLLGSASAFAQSGNNEPLKGDVNEDGTVDVADIAAVIKIMKDGGGTSEETKYYWYAGQTQPSSMTSNPTVDDTNFTNNKWHTLNGNQISQTIKGGTAGNSWYVAVPTSKGFKYYDSTLTEIDETAIKLSTISINNVNYDVWKSNSTGAKTNVYMKTQQQTYYWYVGPTTPTTVDIANIKTSETEIGWHKIEGNPTSIHIGGVSNSTKVNWVVLIPTKFNITKVSNGDDVTDAYTVSTTIIDGVEYRKWVQIQPTKQFDYDMIQQIQNQQYYTYIGPDASFKIVDEDGNLKPNAATNIESMPGVKTSTTLPKSLNDSYPIGTEIKGAEIGNDYVYIIGLASLFNKTTYLVAPTGSPIMMDDLGTFTKDSNIYKVLSTRGPVSTVIVQ